MNHFLKMSSPQVCVSSGEEDEEEIFKMRAKLYRYDPGDGGDDNEVRMVTEYDKIQSNTQYICLETVCLTCT